VLPVELSSAGRILQQATIRCGCSKQRHCGFKTWLRSWGWVVADKRGDAQGKAGSQLGFKAAGIRRRNPQKAPPINPERVSWQLIIRCLSSAVLVFLRVVSKQTFNKGGFPGASATCAAAQPASISQLTPRVLQKVTYILSSPLNPKHLFIQVSCMPCAAPSSWCCSPCCCSCDRKRCWLAARS
jgi:hypothetical protein